MTDFLASSACCGRRPRHLATIRCHPRPDLIARLLRERHVARFLVAPPGFGKTSLAMEYAETVFSFDHVFWLNGKSPCFLRDLDRGTIASALIERESSPFLLVVDDVPALDPPRAEALSNLLDAVLDHSCEVMASLAPTCDAFGSRQHDRLLLSAQDLLLSDAEVDEGRASDERARRPAATFRPCDRVPGLFWGGAKGAEAFLAGVAGEELPADVAAAVFALLALREGDVSDLDMLGEGRAGDVVAFLAESYPYLGIDRRAGRYAAASLPLEPLAHAFSPRFDRMAEAAGFEGRDEFAVRLADELVARGDPDRACDLVRMTASVPRRAAWLAGCSLPLLKACCVLPAHRVQRTLGSAAPASVLGAADAWRLSVLGDETAALFEAERILRSVGVPAVPHAAAGLLVLRRGSKAARSRALSRVRTFVQQCEDGREGEGAPADLGAAGMQERIGKTFWAPLARLAICEGREGMASVVEAWRAERAQGAHPDALALAASWVLSDAARAADADRERSAGGSESGSGPVVGSQAPAFCDAASLEVLGRFARGRVAACEGGPPDLFAAAVGLALEDACAQGALDPAAFAGGTALPPGSALYVHRIEMALLAQRSAYLRAREADPAPDAQPRPRVRSMRRAAPSVRLSAPQEPLLTVNLFGGLDVRIDGRQVDPVLFRRQKVKNLLALLVLNRGREIPRDRIVGMLWPDGSLAGARRNFYGIWSLLRKALRAPDGTCPYLIRLQNGCKLDADLLETDVDTLDAICRAFLLEPVDLERWTHLFGQVEGHFVDGLLPSDDDNEMVVQAREAYRVRLVDALVAASARLTDEGEHQAALWFARAALDRDRTREDVYAALMQAQIDVGQRTAALATYFDCRRFLAGELGIDPSIHIVQLYRAIIEEEERLD